MESQLSIIRVSGMETRPTGLLERRHNRFLNELLRYAHEHTDGIYIMAQIDGDA